MKIITILMLLLTLLFSQNIKQPTSKFTSSGSVVDLLYKDGKVYSATNAGCVDIFDYKSKKLIKKITIIKIPKKTIIFNLQNKILIILLLSVY